MKGVWHLKCVIIIVLFIVVACTPSSIVNGTVVRGYIFLTKWGSLGSGVGQFNMTTGIAVDKAGNVYVVDAGNNRIQKFNSNGDYVMQWGSLGSGDNQFKNPFGIAVDSNGYVYVSDTGNNRIQKFTSNGAFIAKWDSHGFGNGQFNAPLGVAVDDSDNVYVADSGNRVQKLTPNGVFVAKWVGPQGSISLTGVAVDSTGSVYVSDMPRNYALKYSSDGSFKSYWGEPGSGDGQFQYPYGLAFVNFGGIFVADTGNNRIQLFSIFYSYALKWGSRGSGDGEFMNPRGVAVDGSGNVYVADTGNNRIQKFSPVYYTTLRITVKDTFGNMINSALVTSTVQPSGQSTLSGVSGADGRVSFGNILSGNYTLQASKSGFVFWSSQVNLGEGTVDITITLQTEAQLTGGLRVMVKDSTGLPLSGASLSSTMQPTGQSALNGTSGVDGIISFNNVLPGVYTLQVSKTSYMTKSSNATVESGRINDVILTLQAEVLVPGTIKVTILRTNGNPINGATVAASSPTIPLMSLTTGSNGTVKFERIDPGTYTITASRTGYVTKASNVTLGEGAVKEASITLEASGAATLDHFEFNHINQQTENTPFTITIRAIDQRGDVLTSYSGGNTITTLSDLLDPIKVTPNTTSPFTNGVWSGSVSVSTASQSVTLKTTGGGKMGTSDYFEVLRSGYEERPPGGIPSYPYESIIIGAIIALYFISYKSKRTR
jgi:streptogramin lyase